MVSMVARRPVDGHILTAARGAMQGRSRPPLAAFSRRTHDQRAGLEPRAPLVSRFRSSQTLAALSDANFGIKGTLATLCFSAPFEPEVRSRTCSTTCANFGLGALVCSGYFFIFNGSLTALKVANSTL